MIIYSYRKARLLARPLLFSAVTFFNIQNAYSIDGFPCEKMMDQIYAYARNNPKKKTDTIWSIDLHEQISANSKSFVLRALDSKTDNIYLHPHHAALLLENGNFKYPLIDLLKKWKIDEGQISYIENMFLKRPYVSYYDLSSTSGHLIVAWHGELRLANSTYVISSEKSGVKLVQSYPNFGTEEDYANYLEAVNIQGIDYLAYIAVLNSDAEIIPPVPPGQYEYMITLYALGNRKNNPSCAFGIQMKKGEQEEGIFVATRSLSPEPYDSDAADFREDGLDRGHAPH